MSDLISRQAAIDLVRDVCDAVMSGCESWYDPDTGDEVYKDIREVDAILKCNKEIRIALRSMPSVQPERKKGEWIFKDHLWECNQCGCRCNRANPLSGNIWNYYYCPNCGADMRGEEDDE